MWTQIAVGGGALAVAAAFVRYFWVGKDETCPYWVGFLIDNPVRRLFVNPNALLQFATPGAKVADVGCGHGSNALLMAESVGAHGRVWAVDVSPKMLARTRARAVDRKLADRISFAQCTPTDPGLPEGELDFVLLSAVLHECPDTRQTLQGVFRSLRSGGRMLLVEPPGHVSACKLAIETSIAIELGFRNVAQVNVGLLNGLSFQKP